MKYFDRVCRVDVSPDISVEDLRITFEIRKSIESDKNACRVDIYNLSRDTRNSITNDVNSLVRISAGYSQNEGLLQIGQGNISNVVQTAKVPDFITTVYSKDGFKSLRGNMVSISFIEKTTLNVIIDKIINKLGLPVNYADYDKGVSLRNGYSYVGSVQECLDQLALQYNFNWSIQNGEILIIKKDSNTKKRIVSLSASSGLINSPDKIIKTKNLEILNRDEYKVTSLLQPQLEAGDIVNIDSSTIKGNYTIKDLIHKGDTRGNDWYTTMTVHV